MKYMLIVLVSFFIVHITQAQVTNIKNDSPYPTKYLSVEDSYLTLKALTVGPAHDNVGGIYQKVAEAELTELISKDQFWGFSKFVLPPEIKQKDFRIDFIEDQPRVVEQILKASSANGLVVTIITKSMQGLNVKLTLYTADKGQPLLELNFQNEKVFEISEFKKIIENLYTQLKLKLPYKALITSRRGNKITINAGQNANLKANDKLSVAQIVKINRHPKLKFMTGVEKEITGQIRLTKVEEFSSFGEIIFEKETGVIDKNSKLLPPDYIEYPNSQDAIAPPVLDSDKNASEWIPQAAPQYGKLTVMGGFSDYKLSTVLFAGDSYNSGNSLAPTFLISGQLWLTTKYFADVSLQQMFFSGQNSLTGSAPDKLNYTVNTMDLLFGYKFALGDNFWGPSLIASAGYLSKSTKMTDSSPTAFSSFETTGFQAQVGGYFPVTEKNDVGLGVDARFLFKSQLSESPVDSGGASSPTLSQLNLYGSYMYTSNMNLKAQMVFSSVNAGFAGSGSRTNPARSLEEKITSYLFGIEYLF